MKYCTHCGTQITDEAVICIHCGCSTGFAGQVKPQCAKDDTLNTVIKIFLILGCIAYGWMLIPLLWMVPVTVSVFRKLDSNEQIGTGLKIVVLLFINKIAGICLLCNDQ